MQNLNLESHSFQHPQDTLIRHPELTIIVPCLNEEENVPLILSKISEVVLKHSLSVETILIDDYSEDNTFAVATQKIPIYQHLRLRVLRRHHPRRGYGAVLRYGIAHATGKYITFVSADAVDPLDVLPEFVAQMNAGERLVQCTRYGREEDHANLPLKFKISHFFYRFLVKKLIRDDISDSTYPFRIFYRQELISLGIGQTSFSISPEIFFKLILNGAPVKYIHRPQGMRIHGSSKFRFTHEGIRYGYVLLRAWLHKTGFILWF